MVLDCVILLCATYQILFFVLQFFPLLKFVASIKMNKISFTKIIFLHDVHAICSTMGSYSCEVAAIAGDESVCDSEFNNVRDRLQQY